MTIDGQPLGGVIVAFMPKEGRPATATTDVKGFYKLEYVDGVPGAKIGPATVAFFPPTGGTTSHSIPPKYSNNSTSGFNVDIVKGTNTFDFDLKTEETPAKNAPAGRKPVVAD